MESICFEAQVFAPTKPVVALSTIGMLPEGVREAVQQALSTTHTVTEYQRTSPALGPANASSTTLSTSASSSLTRSDFDISPGLIHALLYERPAILLVLCVLDTNDQHDGAIAAEVATHHAESQESHRQLFLLLYAPEGVATQRRERLLAAAPLGKDRLLVLGGDIGTQLRLALEGAEKPYYREQQRICRKQLSSLKERGDGDDAVLLFPTFSSHFKMAYMELFAGEAVSALKAFHAAYTSVIECCRRLSREEQLGILKTIRWACDVAAYKVVWILIARHDKPEADEYLAGHLTWFTPSFTDTPAGQASLHRWRAKLYDAMARILRVQSPSTVAATDAGDYRHLGYYCRVAGENLCRAATVEGGEEEAAAGGEGQRLQLLGAALSILAVAYDTFRRRGAHRSVVVVGGQIAGIYLAMDSYEKALPYLTEAFLFWRSCRADQRLASTLRQLMELSATLQDPKAQLQHYWEYASVNVDGVMDEFDERVREICQALEPGDSAVIDFYRASPRLLKCAVRLAATRAVAGGSLRLYLMISNRSPLTLSPSAITVCFAGNLFPDVILRPSHDILPGGMLLLDEEISLQSHGQLSIESVTLDLLDLPLRFFFPLGTFSLNEHHCHSATWGDASVDWKFVCALSPFSEALLECAVEPAKAQVRLDLTTIIPLIHGHPCPVSVTVQNTTGYDIVGSVRFSGTHDGTILVLDEAGQLVPLASHLLHLECGARSEILSVLSILVQQGDPTAAPGPLTIYAMVDAQFAPPELARHGSILCPDTQRSTAELRLTAMLPFTVTMELQPLPTAAALDPESCHRAGRRCAMVCYRATIKLFNTMDRSAVVLPRSRLVLAGHEGLQFDCCSMAGAGESAAAAVLQLEPGAEAGLIADIAYEGPQPPGEGLFYPQLELQWCWPDYDHTFAFQHDLPALNLYPQSIFVVPVPPAAATRLGKTYPISWLIWNLAERDCEIVLVVEPGEGLVYHGRVQDRLQIPALSCERIGAIVVPLQIGSIRPPAVSLRAARPGDTLLYETLAVPSIESLPT